LSEKITHKNTGRDSGINVLGPTKGEKGDARGLPGPITRRQTKYFRDNKIKIKT